MKETTYPRWGLRKILKLGLDPLPCVGQAQKQPRISETGQLRKRGGGRCQFETTARGGDRKQK
jgi:hypothetical protein